MKKIIFTEKDPDFRLGLADLLTSQAGAIPLIFEVPDDFDMEVWHGVEEYVSTAEKSSQFNVSYPEVHAWLTNYKGTSEFYNSIKTQYLIKGQLSEKQIACVEKAISNEKAMGKNIETGQSVFSLEVGETLVVSKAVANRIAAAAGYERGHRTIEVLAVEGETPKAYRAKVKLSARKTTHCGICGLKLENQESIKIGIGPICADRVSVSYSDISLEELAQKLAVTAEVITWIPKQSIKERIAAA